MSTMPKDAIEVRTYAGLRPFADGIARGIINFMLLCGPPGTAKSRIMRDALGQNSCWIEGNATAFGIYRKLYEFRDKTIVIDDVDMIYRNPAAIRMLKSLCQTERSKTVFWTSRATEEDELPAESTTTSNVCIISNTWKSLDANVKSLVDRGHLLYFNPAHSHIHARVASWFWDREIYQWFGSHLRRLPRLSMRDYVKAAELKKLGVDWQRHFLERIPAAERTVLELVGDAQFASEEERVAAFTQRTGKSRATYFNVKNRLGVAV